MNEFSLGKGVWKFNNGLLKHLEYLELLYYIIKDQTINFPIPVYNPVVLKIYNNYKDRSLKENSDTYLGLLLLRGKKQTSVREKQLIPDTENLESTTDISKAKLDIYYLRKRTKLEQIRQTKVKGEQVQ